MFQFSETSWTRLRTCDPRLQTVMVQAMSYQLTDFMVIEGARTQADQQKLFAAGKTKTMNSKHLFNPSKAVDIAPYPVDWRDLKRFYFLAGIVKTAALELGYPLRWGGDWDGDGDFGDQSFNDLVHFELLEE